MITAWIISRCQTLITKTNQGIPDYSTVKTVLQICQNYHQPFLDCTRQYAALFKNTPYRVITVFLCGPSDPAVSQEAEADKVIFLEHHRDELDGLKTQIIRELKEITQRYEFDVCIAHRNKPTYLALIATQLPVLSVHHAFGDFDRWGRRLLAWVYKKRLTIVAVSNAVRNEIRERLPFFPQEKIFTLYNRVDADLLRSQLLSRKEAREKLNLSQDAFVIANVGRLHPDKDQATLIRGFALALDSLPENSHLVIIGKGKSEAKLQALIAELGLNERVFLTGHLKEARKLFKAFDIFVLSSDHEPFGMVLLEAMAAELPLVSSDCGGAPEVVEGIGRLFVLGNDEDLKKALIETTQTIPDSNLSELSRQQLEKFSDESAKTFFWSHPSIQQLLANSHE